MDTPEKERRQYFRINDYMQLGYEIVPVEKVAVKKREIRQKQLVKSGFQSTGDGQTTFSMSDFKDPGMLYIAEMLQNLSRKLDAIFDVTMSKESDCQVGELVMVDLSASGLRFACNDRIHPGTILHVRFVLNTSPPKRIDVLSKAMRLEINDDAETLEAFLYKVAVKFFDVNEATTELLVQYVFRLQREQLRYKRGRSDGPDQKKDWGK
jgi:c-di-GMP-binding flagellar brake protein YcgR